MIYEINIGIIKSNRLKNLVFHKDYEKEITDDEMETAIEELTSYFEEICGLNVGQITFSLNSNERTNASLKSDVKVKKAIKQLSKCKMYVAL